MEPMLDSVSCQRLILLQNPVLKKKSLMCCFRLCNLSHIISNQRQKLFGGRHLHFWNRIPIFIWIECFFFQQFLCSVTKFDYFTLRHGFISAHLAPGSRFNFHKYIERSLDDDFKTVVGISLPLWVFAVIYLLLNVHGCQAYFWLSFSPLIIILLVGTKLQVIIRKMALEIQSKHVVVQEIPLVRLSDEYFWFGRPQLILFLIHFTLFQNTLEVAFFCFIWFQFGLKSPLYALVIQMGSNMKKAIFDEQKSNAVKRWHQVAKSNMKRNKRSGTVTGFERGESSNQGSSPAHLLHRDKTVGYLDRRQPYHSDMKCQTLECWDQKSKDFVAIKIVRGIQKYRKAGMIEIEALLEVSKFDKNSTRVLRDFQMTSNGGQSPVQLR